LNYCSLENEIWVAQPKRSAGWVSEANKKPHPENGLISMVRVFCFLLQNDRKNAIRELLVRFLVWLLVVLRTTQPNRFRLRRASPDRSLWAGPPSYARYQLTLKT
jgi:hypothetical protein